MTASQPGVFVGGPSTDAWELDPDVGGLTQILCHVPGVWAGLPGGTETTWHITAPFREFWVISGPSIALEGTGD